MQTGAVMARAGRKRKSGERYRSGDIMREPQTSPHEIALRQPHRRHAPLELADDQRAETPFGTLNLIGAVNGEEFRAGIRFAKIVSRYRAAIHAPKSSVASIAGIMEPKGRAPVIEDAEDRTLEYNAAFEALGAVGHTSAVTVARVAVQGEPCPYHGFGALVRGLRALREHFELTDKEKSVSLGNRC